MGRLLAASLAVLALLAGPLAGLEVNQANEVQSDDDLERERFRERREQAANFRVRRQQALVSLPASYHQAAEALLAQSREALAAGDLRQAWEVASGAIERYPYANAAPALLHIDFRYFAATGRLDRAYRRLVDLWERYPEYDQVQVAMAEALAVAENNQRRHADFDLDAAYPSKVVSVSSLGAFLAGDDLLRFLARTGNVRDIAPRARLALARSLLVQGGREKNLEARVAYDEWLNRYPGHPLVFEALTELAIAHLITYRGARYDVGVLFDATTLIDLAELYAGEDEDRIEMIVRYRSLIRRWHQERDMFAASWYREKGKPEGARYYLEEVVKRDPESLVGRRAAQALADMGPVVEEDSAGAEPIGAGADGADAAP